MANVFIYGPYGFTDYDVIKSNSVNILRRIKDINIILFTASIARIDDVIVSLAKEMEWPIIKVNGIEDVYEKSDLAIIFTSEDCYECNDAIQILKDVPTRLITIDENT